MKKILNDFISNFIIMITDLGKILKEMGIFITSSGNKLLTFFAAMFRHDKWMGLKHKFFSFFSRESLKEKVIAIREFFMPHNLARIFSLSFIKVNGSKIAIIASVIFMLVISYLLAARSGEVQIRMSDKNEKKIYIPDDSIIEVIQATPDGEITLADVNKEIYVVFNHPIVPLATLDAETKGCFTVSPKHDGKFRWYGSRICAFVPSEEWKPGVKYSVTVNAGLKSLNGRLLKENHNFSFMIKINPLELESIRTYGSLWNKSDYYSYHSEETIDYDQKFILQFNYPISIPSLMEHLTLKAGGTPVEFTASYLTHEKIYSSYNEYDDDALDGYGPSRFGSSEDKSMKNRIVMIAPLTYYPRNAEVSIVLAQGLKAIDIDSELSKEEVKTYKTHGPLTVSISEMPSTYQDRWRCYFFFNNPVEPARALAAIRFTPELKVVAPPEKANQNFYIATWNVSPGTSYKAHVSPLVDIYGNAMTEAADFDINIPDYRSEFYCEVDDRYSIIESGMKQRIPFSAINYEEVPIFVGTYTIDHIQKELADTNNKYSAFSDISLQTVVWKTGLKLNKGGRIGFDISKYLSQQKTGWIGIKPALEEESRYKEKLIQATDLGLSVKDAYDSSHVWVFSLTRGLPVSGAQVTMLDTSRKLASCITGVNGHCSMTKTEKGVKEKVIFLAETTGDKAYVTSSAHSVSTWNLTNRFDSNAADEKLSGVVIFDRKLYRPGDTMECKAMLAVRSNGNLKPLASEKINIKISNANGGEVLNDTLETSVQGGAWAQWVIPDDAPLGHYKVVFTSDRFNSGGNDNDFYSYYSGDSGKTVNDTFQVEEFRPVSFSVDISGMTDTTVGSKMPITVSGMYLFGAPMQNAPVNVSVTRAKSRLSYSNYSDFIFGDGTYYSMGDDETSGGGYYSGSSGNLNTGGKYTFNLDVRPMVVVEKIHNPQKVLTMSLPSVMTIEASVKDVDDKSVTKSESFTAHTGEFVIGIKALAYYQNFRKPFSFQLVALTNSGQKAQDRKVDVYIIRKNWKSILTKGVGGSVQSKNTLYNELVSSGELVLTGDPVNYTYTPTEAGSYTITVKEKGGVGFSRTQFYAYGGGMTSWDFHDDDSITLVPDRGEYAPGDTANILIQSPFSSGKAIISLEREGVFWQKVVDIEPGGTPVSFPVKDEYLPNVYISAMLLRPRIDLPNNVDSILKKEFIENDLGIPKFKVGVAMIKVKADSRKAKLVIRTDRESYSPGDKIRIMIESSPNAEIALAVADRGVLDCINYRYTDPLVRLFKNWPLGVHVYENRRNLIKQFLYARKGDQPGGAASGMGEDGGFQLDSEDGTRKNIKYTAYWNPNIIADANGKAVVEFKLPDNLTTFRVMSMASANGQYREYNKEFKTRKALVIQPVTPRFIRTGDRLMPGATIINQTAVSAAFIVSIDSDLLSFDNKSKTVIINPGEAREVSFEAMVNSAGYMQRKGKHRAKNDDGVVPEITARGKISVIPATPLQFKTAGYAEADVRDALAFEFPIRETPPNEAFSVSGSAIGKAGEYMVLPDPTMIYPEFGGLTLTLSSSALVGIDGGFRFFALNPYFCLEQRASAFLLGISAGSLLESLSVEPLTPKDYDFSKIQSLFLDELRDFQNSNGGFRPWKEMHSWDYDSPYLTAWVSFVLVMAEKRGYSIDRDILKKAIVYLRGFMELSNNQYGYEYSLETIALTTYVFALWGEPNSSMIRFLYEKENNLSMRGKAYLALAIAEEEKINDYRENKKTVKLMTNLKNRMEITTRKVMFKEEQRHLYEQAYYSTGSTLGTVLSAFMKLDPSNPLMAQMMQYAVADKTSKLWMDSHSSGVLGLALQQYHEEFEGKSGSSSIQVFFGETPLANHSFGDGPPSVFSLSLPFGKLYTLGTPRIQYPLTFNGSEGKRIYYTAHLEYSPVLNVVDERDEGIEIRRELYDLSDSSPKNRFGSHMKGDLKRGNLYLVRIVVTCPKPFFNALINDPIPSNVEIVNTTFETEKKSLSDKTTAGSMEYGWWNAPPRVEYRDDQVIFMLDYLPAGMHEYTYIIRPVLHGKASAPAGECKLMYEPEVFGRTAGGVLTVK